MRRRRAPRRCSAADSAVRGMCMLASVAVAYPVESPSLPLVLLVNSLLHMDTRVAACAWGRRGGKGAGHGLPRRQAILCACLVQPLWLGRYKALSSVLLLPLQARRPALMIFIFQFVGQAQGVRGCACFTHDRVNLRHLQLQPAGTGLHLRQLFMSRPVRTQGHQLPFIHELRVQGACERQGQQGVSRVPGVRTAGIVHFPSLQQCCDKLCEAHRVCNYKHD